MSRLYLYRVLNTDDDGDPLDHGVVRAADLDAAAHWVEDHMREIFGKDWGGISVRFYALRDDGADGVLDGATGEDRDLLEDS